MHEFRELGGAVPPRMVQSSRLRHRVVSGPGEGLSRPSPAFPFWGPCHPLPAFGRALPRLEQCVARPPEPGGRHSLAQGVNPGWARQKQLRSTMRKILTESNRSGSM